MWPGFHSRRRHHIWVEFVVGSLLCSERFSSGYSAFPLSSTRPNNLVPRALFPGFGGGKKPTFPNSNSIWNVRTPLNESYELLCASWVNKQFTIYIFTTEQQNPVSVVRSLELFWIGKNRRNWRKLGKHRDKVKRVIRPNVNPPFSALFHIFTNYLIAWTYWFLGNTVFSRGFIVGIPKTFFCKTSKYCLDFFYSLRKAKNF